MSDLVQDVLKSLVQKEEGLSRATRKKLSGDFFAKLLRDCADHRFWSFISYHASGYVKAITIKAIEHGSLLAPFFSSLRRMPYAPPCTASTGLINEDTMSSSTWAKKTKYLF